MNNKETVKGKEFDRDEGDFKSFSGNIPVIEEHLYIDKQLVETGKVHITKKVLTENYNVDVPVFTEEILVERKPVDRYIEGEAPGIRQDGDITIIPVYKEVMVKRLLLVEEIHVTKRTTEHMVPIKETIRREEVSVKRDENLLSADDRTTANK